MALVVEMARRWLHGGKANIYRGWHVCSDCNGCGSITCTVDRHGFYDDMPTVDMFEVEANEEAMVASGEYDRAWRMICPSCKGRGCYHFDEQGWLIPGTGNEFDVYVSNPVYADYILSDVWRAKALVVKGRAHWTCQRCGKKNVPLEAHHLTYARLGCERPDDLQALCADCHEQVTREGRRNV